MENAKVQSMAKGAVIRALCRGLNPRQARLCTGGRGDFVMEWLLLFPA